MKGFETPFALSLRPGETNDLRELEFHWYWTGWKRRHWPANVLRPGTRLYGFDRRYRALRVLLEVTRGGAFLYKRKREFARKIEQLTGWRPNQNDAQWVKIPPASGSDETEKTGIAIRWRVIKPVRIPLSGRFPS
jgi:hypothetical protein